MGRYQLHGSDAAGRYKHCPNEKEPEMEITEEQYNQLVAVDLAVASTLGILARLLCEKELIEKEELMEPLRDMAQRSSEDNREDLERFVAVIDQILSSSP